MYRVHVESSYAEGYVCEAGDIVFDLERRVRLRCPSVFFYWYSF